MVHFVRAENAVSSKGSHADEWKGLMAGCCLTFKFDAEENWEFPFYFKFDGDSHMAIAFDKTGDSAVMYTAPKCPCRTTPPDDAQLMYWVLKDSTHLKKFLAGLRDERTPKGFHTLWDLVSSMEPDLENALSQIHHRWRAIELNATHAAEVAGSDGKEVKGQKDSTQASDVGSSRKPLAGVEFDLLGDESGDVPRSVQVDLDGVQTVQGCMDKLAQWSIDVVTLVHLIGRSVETRSFDIKLRDLPDTINVGRILFRRRHINRSRLTNLYVQDMNEAPRRPNPVQHHFVLYSDVDRYGLASYCCGGSYILAPLSGPDYGLSAYFRALFKAEFQRCSFTEFWDRSGRLPYGEKTGKQLVWTDPGWRLFPVDRQRAVSVQE